MSWLDNLTGVAREREQRQLAVKAREQAEQSKSKAVKRAETEKMMREEALKERSEAEVRAVEAEQFKQKALQDKAEAEMWAQNERKIKEKAVQEKNKADMRAKEEREKRERAVQEKTEAETRAENERKIKEKALQEKSAAEQRAANEETERKKALKEKVEAEKRVENEKIMKEKALEGKLVAESRAENLAKQTLLLQADNENIDKERQNLLNEKEEMKRLETENMKFNWGPKRKLEWTEKEMERLQKHVIQNLKDSEGNPISLRFLVFGPTGAGKSSFSNGCRSAIEGLGKPTTYHQVAAAIGGSHTRGFHGAQYGDHWIIDMAGIFESNRIDSLNIEDIAAGKVPFYAEITDTLELKEKERMVIPEAGENDVSCVVIVLNYGTELGRELRRQLDVIQTLGGKGVISCHLVLTHLDDCDPQFKHTDNIPNLYKSPKVQEAVKKISEETGIPPYAISFVKNYTTECDTDLYTALLHLRVLENVVFSAVEQVKKLAARKRQRELYTKTTQRKKTTAMRQSGDLEQKNSSKERNAAASEQKKDDPGINVIELKIFVVVLLFAILFIYFKF